jgi:predicted pyridoxine 5'-phosphate oxidase superfamily flavin-nucleotide-binding protein
VLFRKALDRTKADIYDFIAKQKLGVLGTLSSGGSPQSALVRNCRDCQIEDYL